MIAPEEIKRLKGMGFLNNRGTDCFNGRVITKNGTLTSKEMAKVAEAAERFASGKVTFTTRMTVEIMGIPYEKVDELIAFLAEENLTIGGTGPKVRPIANCKGSVCVYGKIDTFAIAEKIHERFYEGYRSVVLPHKFKIGVGGCPNNCIKPNLNDIGLVGNEKPLMNQEKCKACKKCAMEAVCPVNAVKTGEDGKKYIDESACIRCGKCVAACYFKAADSKKGIRIFIGGKWGKTNRHGTPIQGMYTPEEAMDMVEKTILLYKDQGIKGERLGTMVDRLGMEAVEAALLSNDLLERKAEILAK